MLKHDSTRNITILVISGCIACDIVVHNVKEAVAFNTKLPVSINIKNYKDLSPMTRKQMKLKDFPTVIFRKDKTETFRFSGSTAVACINRYIDLYLK